MKEDFPPISLPKREYMERARQIWEELGLPQLKPESPWYGYSLGEWPEDFDARRRSARSRATTSRPASSLEKRQRNDVGMNTEVRSLGHPQDSDE